MTILRHRVHLLSKRNYELIYFANVYIAANMSELMDTGSQFFDKELANDVILMTPIQLNRLLDAARSQGRDQW